MLYFIYGLVDPTLVDETSDGVDYVGTTNNPNRRLLEHVEMRGVDGVKNGWIKYLLDSRTAQPVLLASLLNVGRSATRERSCSYGY
jgi:hypothetical protein